MSRSELATTENEDDAANGSQSANTGRQTPELGGDQGRGKRCRKRTLAAPRPVADFLRCRDCTFVTTEKARMSEHISSHSQQQQQQGRQDHENSEEDQSHQTSKKYLKIAPEASKESILNDGPGCETPEPDWQRKFTDFVGTEKAVNSEPDPNASDAGSRQNPEGEMEESPGTTVEFFVVEDIQEEVEIETDANANYQ